MIQPKKKIAEIQAKADSQHHLQMECLNNINHGFGVLNGTIENRFKMLLAGLTQQLPQRNFPPQPYYPSPSNSVSSFGTSSSDIRMIGNNEYRR